MPNFKPIKQPRISEEVFNQLKEAILSNDFRAGDRLPSERDLAEQFQVSRVAIREAIRALENNGFVSIRQGAAGGAFVTDLTFEQLASACLDLFLANKISIHELHQVRMLIEPEVARLATLNANPEFAKRLLKAFEGITLTIIHVKDQSIRHLTPLSDLQKEILKRLELDDVLYQHLEIHKT